MTRRIAVFALLALTNACSESAPPGAGAALPGPAVEATSGVGSRVDLPTPDSVGNVLVLGTSLTAGYGVGAENAYPAVLQQKIDSAGLPYRVVNAGLSGETSAGGLRRLDWSLQQPVDVLVLELGANDGLRGQSVDALHENLDRIIERTRESYPDAGIVIAGMEAPPNMGPRYTEQFRAVFRDLAREHDAALVPFLLEGVAGEPALNQDDGLHPTAAGQRMLAATVWRVLGPLLESRAIVD